MRRGSKSSGELWVHESKLALPRCSMIGVVLPRLDRFRSELSVASAEGPVLEMRFVGESLSTPVISLRPHPTLPNFVEIEARVLHGKLSRAGTAEIVHWVWTPKGSTRYPLRDGVLYMVRVMLV